VCVTDSARLFRILDGLEGGADECCACVMSVVREAERFKRQSLAEKLRDFLQRRLSQPTDRPSVVASVGATSSPLSRTLHNAVGMTLNCNHNPSAV